MFEIGRVIENPSEPFKGIAGIELLLFNLSKVCPANKDERLIFHPTTKKETEIFYRDSFENFGREWIKDDYKYFLEYMLSPYCELTCSIPLSDLENVREATKEDAKRYKKEFDDFVDEHELEIESEG